MSYLIDSDWLINAINRRGAAFDVLENLADRGLAVSVISVGEVYAGVVGKPDEAVNIEEIDRFLTKTWSSILRRRSFSSRRGWRRPYECEGNPSTRTTCLSPRPRFPPTGRSSPAI